MEILTNAQAVILGVVEGITEYLPISSTGHMVLVSHYLGIAESDTTKVFEIAIQAGAILAMFIIYWKKFLDLELVKKLIVAFLPTGILGFLFFKYVKEMLGSEMIVVVTLLLGGIVIIWAEKYYKHNKHQRIEEIDYKNAIIVGFAQAVAMIPGVSRSGATIVCGLFMNIERKVIAEFTFLLAVPTMAAATLYSLYKSRDILSVDYLGTLSIGFIVSFIVAYAVIKVFLNYIKKYDFIPFGIYRILLALIILLAIYL
jgi:undecaprenyl-diphosphatase